MRLREIIFYKIFLFFLFFCFGYAKIIFPISGDTLNYRQLPIEWQQEPSTIAYNLQLYKQSDISTLILDVIDSSLIYIIDESIIDWDESYIVYLRSIFNQGLYSEWIDSSAFNTYDIPEDYGNSSIETNIFMEDQYQPGITFLQRTVINKEGENIFFWSTPNVSHDGMNFTFSHLLNNGNLLGWLKTYQGTTVNAGVEIDFDGNFHWSTDEPVHHDLFPMPNGNYLGLVKEIFYTPPPEGP